MQLWRTCARRTAILAALSGGVMLAVVGAQYCSVGLVWLGGACHAGVMSAYAMAVG